MSYRFICTVFLALIAGPVSAQVNQVLPPMGGPGGGQFQATCGASDILVGVAMQVGDDVDAIRPLCARAVAPTVVGQPYALDPLHGGDGGAPLELRCPAEAPAVNGLEVAYEGEAHIIINNVHLFCSLALPNQALTTYPTQVFDGPMIVDTYNIVSGHRNIPLNRGMASCPAGLVAIGITGRAGSWLDALNLICGKLPYDPTPKRPDNEPAKTLGRVDAGPSTPKPSASICDSARDALSRQSPASPNLVSQCSAAGGSATSVTSNADLENVRLRGEYMSSMDDAAGELRKGMTGGALRGFEIGLGIWDHDAANGPGKQRYHDALTRVEQQGFDVAADYALPKNKHAKLIAVGSGIAKTDAEVAAARSAEPDPFFSMGFDIASGLFGDPAAGSEGSKVMGSGAMAIRNSLTAPGRRGFDASTKLHLARKYP